MENPFRPPVGHTHSWVWLGEEPHAEIDEADPVRHTSFTLAVCPGCRGVSAFPAANLALVTPRYREKLEAWLAEQRWYFIEDEVVEGDLSG